MVEAICQLLQGLQPPQPSLRSWLDTLTAFILDGCLLNGVSMRNNHGILGPGKTGEDEGRTLFTAPRNIIVSMACRTTSAVYDLNTSSHG